MDALTLKEIEEYVKDDKTNEFIENMRSFVLSGNEFVFNDENHTYLLNHNELPSVTTIMKPLSQNAYHSIDNEVLQKAADRGTAVHAAVEDYMKEGWLETNEETKPYLDGFCQFEKDYSPKFLLSEVRIFHKELQYAGTCDLVFEIDGELVVVDIKTTSVIHNEMVRIQLEAYKRALISWGLKIKKKAILQLKKDGKYKFVWYDDEDIEAWGAFRSCLNLANYVVAKKIKEKIYNFFFNPVDKQQGVEYHFLNNPYIPVPSISDIFGALYNEIQTMVPPEDLKELCEKEKSVHNAAIFYLEQNVMEISPDLQGYADAFISFYDDQSKKMQESGRKLTLAWDDRVLTNKKAFYGTCSDFSLLTEDGVELYYLTISEDVPDAFILPYLEGISWAAETNNTPVSKYHVLILSEDGTYREKTYSRKDNMLSSQNLILDLIYLFGYLKRN